MSDFAKPAAIDDATFAFPATLGGLLPPMDEIPDEFLNSYDNKWVSLVSGLFYKGGNLPATKPGIDAKAARRHIGTVLGSYEPAHEHKIAGAAYLASLWYQEPTS